jgi:restriction system protein
MSDTPRFLPTRTCCGPRSKQIRALGGSASINEIVEKVVELEGFTEEQQAVPHGDAPQSQIEYRLAWARSYLKGMGLLDNSARGIWTLTEKGRDPSLDQDKVLKLLAEHNAKARAQQKARRKAERDRAPDDVDE